MNYTVVIDFQDIVVMTNDATRCPYYESESQNVKPRYYCHFPYMTLLQAQNEHNWMVPINQTECEVTKPRRPRKTCAYK